ncbi:MAG TPA: primosomal protein [Mycobacterium sp.]|nr:primosomal protein [Mycobacterium sp.]
MAADLVPIRLSLTAGDRYTVWAPQWRDSGDEWEAFLGRDDDLYGFESPADLVAFVRTNTDNDLVDHPGWTRLTQAGAHRLDPADRNRFDLIAVEELLADKPTEKALKALAGTLSMVSSIGSVCELPAVTKFFNGNPSLGTLASGIDAFTGRAGRKRWNAIGEIIGRHWADVLDAIDAVVATPDVDSAMSARAADELAQPRPEEDLAEAAEEDEHPEETTAGATGRHAGADERGTHDRHDQVVLGSDEDFWVKVGIDPIRILTGTGTFYTLRCYLGEHPVFLGRNGRISVFGSERALARYLADEHDHDLSDLATYDDIRTAATDGSLSIDIADENVYVLTGLADDLTDGPDAVDRDQLDLAVEFLRDVGSYAEDGVVDQTLKPDRPLGKLVGYVLDPKSASKPKAPFAAAVKDWEQLERFVESRLRRE